MKLEINIREAYGMSENFNVISMNPAGAIKIGSVGKLFPGQEVIIDKRTNEIKQKCSWLMKCYYRNPKQTAETIVHDYLLTGDMGELTEDGYLKTKAKSLKVCPNSIDVVKTTQELIKEWRDCRCKYNE